MRTRGPVRAALGPALAIVGFAHGGRFRRPRTLTAQLGAGLIEARAQAVGVFSRRSADAMPRRLGGVDLLGRGAPAVVFGGLAPDGVRGQRVAELSHEVLGRDLLGN